MCVRRWIWGRIGCNRSRVKNIADGNKRSSYVFLAVWISLQCNFSGKSFCLFLISAVNSAVCTHAYIYTHAHSFQKKMFFCIFFYASLIVRRLFWDGECAVCHYWQLSACGAFVVKPNIDTRAPVSNYTELWMNSRVFFSDDNRDECHLGVISLWRCARCEDPSPDFTLEALGYACWSSAPWLWLRKLMISFYLFIYFWISDSIVLTKEKFGKV